MLDPYSAHVLWIVIVSVAVGFVLAFGIGANSVPNSFATSIGSKVLSVKQACCLGTVFEIAGSMLLGYKVSGTVRKGILQVDLYEGAELELMLGMFAALSHSGTTGTSAPSQNMLLSRFSPGLETNAFLLL